MALRNIRKATFLVMRDSRSVAGQNGCMTPKPHTTCGLETPQIVAEAEFTEDMVETLQQYFSVYQVDGVVRVEVSTKGLWLPNPATNSRQFLGLARLPKGRSQ